MIDEINFICNKKEMSVLGKSYQHGFSLPLLNSHQQKENSEEIDIKLAIVGESSVGKTSLTHRIVNGMFSPDPQSTIGSAFCVYKRKRGGKTYTFKMWDTAGQERYKSLVPMYLKGAKIVLIVFDITSLESFYQVKNCWYPHTLENAEGSINILIGTKLDLNDHRQVATDEAEEYAERNNMSYIECSAKSAINTDSVIDLMISSANKIEELKKDLDAIREDIIRLDDHQPRIRTIRTTCGGNRCYPF